jgi:hypothetical protein
MSKKQKKVLWPLLGVALAGLCVLAGVSARTKTAATSTPEWKEAAKLIEPPKSSERSVTNVMPSSSAFPPIQSNPQNQRIEAELISIRPSGFEPTQITRPKGPFLLAIENRSGLKQIEFQLGVERGMRLFQIKRSWERSNWNQVVDPPAGQYVLTEANHPDWKCTISITEK